MLNNLFGCYRCDHTKSYCFRSLQTTSRIPARHSCNHLGTNYWILFPQKGNEREERIDLEILVLVNLLWCDVQ